MSASNKKKLRKEQNAAAMTEKQLQEQKNAKSLKRYTMTFVISMALIVALVIGITLYNPVSRALDRNTIALTVGNNKLNTTMMNYFLVDAIENARAQYEEAYGDYAFMYAAAQDGLDYYKSLAEQEHPEQEGKTWGQVFIDKAVEDAKSIYSLYDEAVKNGHKLTEDEETSILSNINTMTAYAIYYAGCTDLDQYLRGIYCSTANKDNYTEYLTAKAMAQSYSNAYFDGLEYVDNDYREHEKEDYYYYSSYNFSAYEIVVSDYRQGGTKDEDGVVVYSDAEISAAQAAAKADADAFSVAELEDVEAFNNAIASLTINKDNEDAASTLYTKQFGGKTISSEDLREWLSDAERKAGDVGVFPQTTKDADGNETITSYSVIMFHSGTDNLMNLVNVRHILLKVESTTDSDGNTVLKEESKQAKELEAKALLDEFLNGESLTGEAFGLLAKEHSDDGSKDEGGLIEEIYPGMTVEAFDNWCFDTSRKIGDTDIILTDYGYHVMFFDDFCEMTYRDLLIDSELRDDATSAWMEDIVKNANVVLGNTSRMNTDRTIG